MNIKHRTLLFAFLFAINISCKSESVTDSAKTSHYPIYDPQVEIAVVNKAFPDWSPQMGYNHDSDITKFKGKYIVMWNANQTTTAEGQPGQYNYVSYSTDFVNWSRPYTPFTSGANAINPIDADSQWQPNFINYLDQTLFVAWMCKEKTYISRSNDGVKWENILVSPQYPEAFNGTNFRAFPSNHGLLTKNNDMIFPVCFIERSVGMNCPNVALLISRDGGNTWHWSNITNTISIQPYIRNLNVWNGAKTQAILWEPHVFEKPNGDIGLFVRCNNIDDGDGLESDQLLWYAESTNRGETFSTPRPLKIYTLSSRSHSASMKSSVSDLMFFTNDWYALNPVKLNDRNYLSLYLSPVCDPELLIPGPLIQPYGTTAYYPNAEVTNSEIMVSYTVGRKPMSIYASRIKTLPNYNEPFFVKRSSRPEVIISNQYALFTEASSSMGLVLTPKLTNQDSLVLSFSALLSNYPPFYAGNVIPENEKGTILLTIGGGENSTMLELRLTATARTEKNNCDVQVKNNGKWTKIATINPFDKMNFRVVVSNSDYKVSLNDFSTVKFTGKVFRRINFGGFFQTPVDYPTNSTFLLDLNSVKVE